MEAEDLVDAALVGFDRKELVTIPAVPDVAAWDAFEQVAVYWRQASATRNRQSATETENDRDYAGILRGVPAVCQTLSEIPTQNVLDAMEAELATNQNALFNIYRHRCLSNGDERFPSTAGNARGQR